MSLEEILTGLRLAKLNIRIKTAVRQGLRRPVGQLFYFSEKWNLLNCFLYKLYTRRYGNSISTYDMMLNRTII
jgi:hypothetical protein